MKPEHKTCQNSERYKEDKSMLENKSKPQSKERYDFSIREPYWQKFWEREKAYGFEPDSEKPLYTIDTPPPTISGSLHLGHIYSYTQAEVVARYKRMNGFNVRYPFGYDDNGLPTERLVEKELGIRAQDRNPKDFYQECIEVIERYSNEFKELWKSVGLSVDWHLEYSTISDEVQKLSQETFISLFRKGIIYRQEAPALYCHECATSIAQAEVEDKEIPSVFYDIAFSSNLGREITISTTRPELLPACVAVFVNPQDKRYKDLVGQEVTTPLGDAVKVIADDLVSMEKGSGAVMCCTFGDETDLHWVRKYGLPHRIIINNKGRITKLDNASFLQGLTITEARKEIVNRLKKQGHIRGERQIVHSVGVHERCSTPVEIVPRIQWFVRILDKKDELIEAGKRIKWYPPNMEKRFINWVTNLKWDWCISRERFFGIPVPVYICENCNDVVLPKEDDLPLNPKEKKIAHFCPHCNGRSLKPETTVLDTWFTSSLTPDINNNHPLNRKLRGKILPISMRPQAHDIIRTWAVYTILMSIYNHDNIPWKDIMISGHVLVKKGEKISKKTGGGRYKPQELISQHSADAIRYAMCKAGLGKDSYYDDTQVRNGKKLVTKLYNSGRFALANLVDFDPRLEIDQNQLVATDKWIIQRTNETLKAMRQELDRYEFAKALQEFEKFFWNNFTDNYLELVKGRLYLEDNYSTKRRSAQFALNYVYLKVLQMAAPFLPHIAEEMYHSNFVKTGHGVMQGKLESESEGGYFYRQTGIASIHNTQWGEGLVIEKSEEIIKGASLMLNVLKGVREYKSKNKISLEAPLQRLVVVCKDEKQKALVLDFIPDLKSVNKLGEIVVTIEGDNSDYRTDLILKLSP